MDIQIILIFSYILFFLKVLPNIKLPQFNNSNTKFLRGVDYNDELIKVENQITTEIYNVISTVDDKNYHEFYINCLPYLNNETCDEYMHIKYNMSLNEQEFYVVDFMYDIFNKNITIMQTDTDICCNLYMVYW